MIVSEQVLGNLQTSPIEKTVIPVPYEWFELERRRIKKTAADGTELGVAIPGGVEEGDILYETESACYAVQLVQAHLISVAIHSVEEAARVGFELGNRHLSLKILPDKILVPYEEPTCLYLKQLGFEVTEEQGSFDHFIRCKAHGASGAGHDHDHHDHHHGHVHTHVDENGNVYTHSHE